jgi:hypothetical protein
VSGCGRERLDVAGGVAMLSEAMNRHGGDEAERKGAPRYTGTSQDSQLSEEDVPSS